MKQRKKTEKSEADAKLVKALKVFVICLVVGGGVLGFQWLMPAMIDGFEHIVHSSGVELPSSLKETNEEVLWNRAVEGQGNTNQNIAEGGVACLKDGYLYYVDTGKENHVFCQKEDGEPEEIVKERCSYLNIWENWIYYCGANLQIHRKNLENGESEQLTNHEGWIYAPKIVDGVVYYENDYRLWRMDIDGGNPKQLTEEEVLYCCVWDNYIYFVDKSNNRKGCMMSLDGEGYEVWTEEAVECIDCVNGRIYYSLCNSGGIYSFKADKPNKQTQVSDVHNTSFNVYGNWIYFSNYNEGKSHALYKMNLKGEQMTELCDTPSKMINVAGSWVFCQKEKAKDEWKGWYRIRTDGTDKQKMS